MSVDAQLGGRPGEYRWRPLRKFPNSIPCTTPQSLADVRCSVPSTARSDAANIEERKTWMQSEFCTWQNSVTGARAPENVCVVYQSRRRPNVVQFGWSAVSDVAAVTNQDAKPIEICWGARNSPTDLSR